MNEIQVLWIWIKYEGLVISYDIIPRAVIVFLLAVINNYSKVITISQTTSFFDPISWVYMSSVKMMKLVFICVSLACVSLFFCHGKTTGNQVR